MNSTVKVLMERDGMSEVEAQELFEQTRQEIFDCGDDYNMAEDIMASNLGLEMDYIMDFF